MAWETWQTVKQERCSIIKKNAALESRLVFAADRMPDQPPRVVSYRCSYGESCTQSNKTMCPWDDYLSPG
jgi:hypothetical protein